MLKLTINQIVNLLYDFTVNRPAARTKEDMLNMYPEQERVNTIEKMRRCESTWYDHCKPAKWGSKYVGGGNLIDYESLRLIERPYEQKLNIGLIREEPTLNNNYSNSFRGEVNFVISPTSPIE